MGKWKKTGNGFDEHHKPLLMGGSSFSTLKFYFGLKIGVELIGIFSQQFLIEIQMNRNHMRISLAKIYKKMYYTFGVKTRSNSSNIMCYHQLN